jgi:signal transduction histidine kinase
MIRFLRRRLLFRVTLNGVILLLISAGGFLGLAAVLFGGQARQAERTMTDWFARAACQSFATTPTISSLESYPVSLVMYSSAGEQLASSTHEPLEPPTKAELSLAAKGEAVHLSSSGQTLQACADAAERFVSVGGPRPKPELGRLFVSVALLVLIVALGSIPLARSLVKPLRELVATAARFGEGDLSARARLERIDEIGDLAVAFNAMAAKLEARLLAEKEMLANISHELRTPLARVRVVLELAREDPARAASLLGEVSRDFTELEHLTDDVLATVRLDFEDNEGGAGQQALRLRLTQVELIGLLRHSVTRAVEAHPEREYVLDTPVTLPELRADPALLRRLFDNLLENARKYSTGSIVVGAREESGALVVRVRDSGIGIERADLERIFEPFFRTDRSRQRATGGSGLGLALCRRIAELHGGSIHAESADGETTVTVRLLCTGPAPPPA